MTHPQTPRPASARARVVSYLVDAAVVISAGLITWPLAHSALIAALVSFETLIVINLARAATGRTPGAVVTKTIAYAVNTDHAPGLGRQSMRSAIQAALHLTVLGPLISAATSRDGRDLADRACGTGSLALINQPTPTPQARHLNVYGHTGARPATQPAPSYAPPPTSALPGTAAPAHLSRPPWQSAPEVVQRPSAAPVSAPPPVVAMPSVATPQAPPVHQPRYALEGIAPVAPTAPPLPTVRPPGAAPAAPIRNSTPVGGQHRAWAALDTGQRIDFSETVVLGREPTSSVETEQLVTVPDPTRSLSRTHLRIGIDDAGLWIEDASSANGTAYLGLDGHWARLVGGQRTRVPDGTVVMLGNRRLTLRQKAQTQ